MRKAIRFCMKQKYEKYNVLEKGRHTKVMGIHYTWSKMVLHLANVVVETVSWSLLRVVSAKFIDCTCVSFFNPFAWRSPKISFFRKCFVYVCLFSFYSIICDSNRKWTNHSNRYWLYTTIISNDVAIFFSYCRYLYFAFNYICNIVYRLL